MKAMILAAGLGTRMRPLTLTTPKPLVPVLGKPLIAYHLERLAAAGVAEVVINISWLADKVEHVLGDGSAWGLKITYSREDTPLETAGGIKKVIDLLCADSSLAGSSSNDCFLVINGDVYCDLDIAPLLDLSPQLAHLVLVDNPTHNPNGDFGLDRDETGAVNQAGLSHKVCLKENESGSVWTFSGISVLNRRLFDTVPDDGSPAALGPLLKTAILESDVSGSVHAGYWLDVGTLERLAELETYIKIRNA